MTAFDKVGEVCERGERSDKGSCRSDCFGWEQVTNCGDGKVDAPEECEKDTTAAYCVECKLAKPELRIESLTLKMTSEQWGPEIVTHNGSVSRVIPLPTKASANDCGRYEVVESTASLVRVEFTHCNAATSTRAKWRFAVPRQSMTLSSSADPSLKPEATFERIADGRSMPYETLSKLQGRVVASANHVLTAEYDIELTHYAVGGGGKAYLEMTFELLPPPPR